MKKITLLFTLFAFAFGFSQNGGDDCASAVVVAAGSFVDTTINDVTAGTNNGDSAWFSFTAPGNGTMAISVCADPDDPDTRVFVFTDGCGTLTPFADDDDGCDGTFESTLAAPVTSGTEYLIQFDDRWSVAPFDWELIYVACTPPTVDAPTVVDDCANNMFSIDINFTDLGNSTALTITNSVNADVVNVNATGVATIGPFPTDTLVDFTINHESDADCNLVGTNFTDGCPQSNDECAGAIPVNCDDTITGTTATGATDSGGNSNAANDLWYSYTGSGTAEDVTVTLCNSAYDTAVRVYTDCSVTAGAQVLFNDDACGTGGTRSEGTFASDGTSTYYIMVEGWNASNGAFEMTISCAANVPAPPNDLCSNAQAIALDTLTPGTTAGATDDSTGGTDDTTCEGFTFKSDVWYAFQAADADVSIETVITGNSDQANVAVYSSLDCSQLDADSIACSAGNGGEAINVVGLTPSALYYVRVWSDGVALAPNQDGQTRAEGTFNITVNDATLSTTSFDVNGFEYFPNPVNDNLSLRAQDNIQNVAVYNMLGQQVSKMTPNALNSEVNMSNLSQGAYFVKVTINDATQTIRVLKK